MSYPEHENQVLYRKHYTPTHKPTHLQRAWSFAKNFAEAFVFMVFAWVVFTAIVHFLILG